jgi:hypothetical protein
MEGLEKWLDEQIHEIAEAGEACVDAGGKNCVCRPAESTRSTACVKIHDSGSQR